MEARGFKRQQRIARREAILSDLRAGFPVETVSEVFGMQPGWVYALAAANGIPVVRRLCKNRLGEFLRNSKVRCGGTRAALDGHEAAFIEWLVDCTEPGETLADTLVGIAEETFQRERKEND